MTTALQIAKDRTTKNRKAKEHALKNAEKWTDPSSGEKKNQNRTTKSKSWVEDGRGKNAQKVALIREKGALRCPKQNRTTSNKNRVKSGKMKKPSKKKPRREGALRSVKKNIVTKGDSLVEEDLS